MSEKFSGIILNVRKYNDKNLIITLFTRHRGRLAFISTQSSGKAANIRRAKLQPLAVISSEMNFKPAADLQRLGQVTTEEIWTQIYFHPVKRLLALFISEFLYRLLNATMPDPSLFDFLVNSLRLLDRTEDKVADFHIPFLISLLSFSGISPDVSGFSKEKVFDFASGAFIYPEEAQGPIIEGEDAEMIPLILRINFSNIKKFRLTNVNRRKIFYGLLNYYSFHFPGISSLKSPGIMHEIFD